ncbi:MAG: hypothetical protein ACLQQ4_08150 [Bacteroidia bacterium]
MLTNVVSACSMFKITFQGKTIVGNNEDSRRLKPEIWFENGNNGKYGAVYVGYDTACPQGGMNEYGLTYDGFDVPQRNLRDQSAKKNWTESYNMKKVMLSCKNINEAYTLLSHYDLSPLNGVMLWFIDKDGKYLVVEADTLIMGNDSKYVLSNFCPSQVRDLNSVTIERYKKGRKFLANKMDTSINFCTGMMDTMHVCRSKIGDGTLYTTIYDLNEDIVYLYFYHHYSQSIRFDLKHELAKGYHIYSIPTLFPQNKEYIKFTHYKTPANSTAILLFLISCSGLFLFSSLFFLISYLKKIAKNSTLHTGHNSNTLKLGLFVLSSIMFYYMIILLRNEPIYYFDTPYKIGQGFSLINLSAYIPVTLAIIFLPIIYFTFRVWRKDLWTVFSKWLLTANTLTFILLLMLFNYWKLFSVF